MIDLHYWPTPNGHKITLFLEETGLPYRIVPVDIGRGEQFRPDFLAIAPNNRMPAIVDHAPADGGAAGLACSNPAPSCSTSPRRPAGSSPPTCAAGSRCCSGCSGRWAASGPMAGQNHHFAIYAPERLPYAIDRYVNETNRLYGVLDSRLADRPFVAGEDYSIADMASYPWIVRPRAPGPEARRLPQPRALVPRDRGPAGDHPRLRDRPAAPAPRDADGRGGQEDPVRPDRGGAEALGLRRAAAGRTSGRSPRPGRRPGCRRARTGPRRPRPARRCRSGRSRPASGRRSRWHRRHRRCRPR